MACVRKGSKSGFVNTKGEVAIQLKYEWAEDFSEGIACVQDNMTGKFGYINKKGKTITIKQ